MAAFPFICWYFEGPLRQYLLSIQDLCDVKLTEVWGPLCLGPHRIFDSQIWLSALSCQQFNNYISGFSTLELIPVSYDFLYLSICLSSFGGSSLPYNLTFLMNLRGVDFSAALTFYPLLERSDEFQARAETASPHCTNL